jgi:putative pyruvate formate lyase activating enzyme
VTASASSSPPDPVCMRSDPYAPCLLCPRACAVDRTGGDAGFCGETRALRAGCACLHFGEEPPVTGAGGSGTVFFTGCTLRCRACQNAQLSREGYGAELSVDGLAGIFLRLQREGAENVNAVTGTHFLPGIIDAWQAARARGLAIPLVWNSSGYETVEAVRMLAPHVSFFLPDLKTLDPALSARWFAAPDYPRAAADAILAMAAARPLERGPDGLPIRGLIVRHLVLPGRLDATREALAWFRENLAGRALLSLMSQYTPIPGHPLAPPFDRCLTRAEWDEALAVLGEMGIEDGYVQELVPGTEWLPDFTRERPFPSQLSRMVWHARDGAPGG